MISLTMASRIAEVYSKTLFEIAAQQQSTDAVNDDLAVLTKLITEENSFLDFMKSPYFPLAQKQALIENVFSGQLNNLTFNFLMVVVFHKRIPFLQYIIEKYKKLYHDFRNYLDVEITVSQALSRDNIEAVRTALSAAMNSDKIILDITVVPSIMGGTIIRYNNMVVDNSIRHRMHRAVDAITSRSKK